MTFLDLQKQIVQTRKARHGVANRRDYFVDVDAKEEIALNAIYQRALRTANEVVKHYEITGEFDRKEKISVVFGEKKPNKPNKKEHIENNKMLIFEAENKKLKQEIANLQQQIKEIKDKQRHGGRKGYNDTMVREVKTARANGETWRGLASRLGISTTTAQKLFFIT